VQFGSWFEHYESNATGQPPPAPSFQECLPRARSFALQCRICIYCLFPKPHLGNRHFYVYARNHLCGRKRKYPKEFEQETLQKARLYINNATQAFNRLVEHENIATRHAIVSAATLKNAPLLDPAPHPTFRCLFPNVKKNCLMVE